MIKMPAKCQVCNKWNAQVKMTCSYCSASFLLCNSCKQKRSNQCSACGHQANWSFEDFGSSVSTGTTVSDSDRWAAAQEEVKARRAKEDETGGIHREFELVDEEVAAIRRLRMDCQKGYFRKKIMVNLIFVGAK